MADWRISRRRVVPGIAAGTAAALFGATVAVSPEAEAAKNPRFSATAGPCSLWPGHTLRFQFFLPAGVHSGSQASKFRLVLKTLDGNVLVTHDFQLQPGMGMQAELALTADGILLFNGQPLGAESAQLLAVLAIIAILIGLLVPAVQKVQATSTSFVPDRPAGEQNVDYILPFVEQDNLVS